jgi:hypothetical protein
MGIRQIRCDHSKSRRSKVAQQTWVITFTGVSLSEANQYASQLKEALQSMPHDILVRQQSSVTSTQNLGEMVVATIKDHSAIAAVAYVIVVFLQSRNRVEITIKVKDTEIHAKNLNARNVKEDIENLVKQARVLRSVEE